MRQKATILLPGKDTGYYLRIRNRRREYIIGRKTSLLQHLTVQTADCTLPQEYAQPYPKTKLFQHHGANAGATAQLQRKLPGKNLLPRLGQAVKVLENQVHIGLSKGFEVIHTRFLLIAFTGQVPHSCE